MNDLRSGAGNGDDNVGIPDDLRCKRSDGKQWRCTAMSMPDKTVCEKHYIQAKKRAANSALRASLKKAKRISVGESPVYMESKSDDKDTLLVDAEGDQDLLVSALVKKHKDKDRTVKNQALCSPESPELKNAYFQSALNSEDDVKIDLDNFDESRRSCRASPSYAMESSRNMSQRSTDNAVMATSEVHSEGDTDSSNDTGGLTCHQCRRGSKGSVVWCLKCDRRGYCDSCISTW